MTDTQLTRPQIDTLMNIDARRQVSPAHLIDIPMLERLGYVERKGDTFTTTQAGRQFLAERRTRSGYVR